MSLFRKKDLSVMLAQAEDGGKGLKRTLGAGNLVALGVGAIIGAGFGYFVYFLAREKIKGQITEKRDDYGPI